MKTLKKVMEILCNDQGLGMEKVTLKDVDWDNESLNLVEIDEALSKLSKEELETLCVGDQEEWPPILEKLGVMADPVHRALDFMWMSTAI